MPLQAHIDGSGDGSPVFVLAGYIATAETWADFSVEWDKMLPALPAGLKSFKMSQMAQSEDRLEKASWFYRIIERHVDAAISCVVHVSDLIDATREVNWPPFIKNAQQLENPYYFAFKAIINVFAQHQEKMGIREPVDFIFDEQSEKNRVLDAWDLLKESFSADVQAFMGNTPIYRDDEKVMPLQAADLYAWWVRRWEIEDETNGVSTLKFPWEIKKDIPRIHMTFSGDDFKEEYARALNDPQAILRALRKHNSYVA